VGEPFGSILLAIAVTGALGIGLTNGMIAVGIVFSPQIARLVRARALVVRQELYVDAARCLGASNARILWKHVLPNAIQPVIVQVTLLLAGALLADRANALSMGANTGSLAGQFGIGLLLGVVWSPCSGPALGAAIGLAAQAGGLDDAALRMAFFGLGAGTILALIAYGSRAAVTANRARLMNIASAARPIAGAVFIALGVMTLTGYDKVLERAATNVMPEWLINLTTSV
jgi:cytochrome c biogenesis protein CcdA